MRIFFRTDASMDIGSGHVMRCLTLARELRDRGYDIHFICRDLPGNMADFISTKGYQVSLLNFEEQKCFYGILQQDVFESKKIIGKNMADWVIVDHYDLDYRWHQAIRSVTSHLFVIDDLANRALDCDILLDQTYGRCEDSYKNFVSDQCVKLVGSKFALLRPEFSKKRQFSLDRRNNSQSVQRILVFLGGMDSDNVTSKIIDALVNVKWQSLEICRPQVCVILNENAPNISGLVSKIRSINDNNLLPISLETNVSDMAEAMSKADLAIGAAGSASWERCCLGLPTLAVVLADNQKLIMEKLDEFGAVINLGQHSLLDIENLSVKIGDFCKQTQRLSSLIDRSQLVCDGMGVYRCANNIVEFNVG